MVVGFRTQRMVYSKTRGRCAICGGQEDLLCCPFIPAWTRLPVEKFEVLIPLCISCNCSRGHSFLELGQLSYLPSLYIEQLMRYYRENEKYLKQYVRKFGNYRTRGLLDVDRALLVLESYDDWIRNNALEINWEDL